MLLQLAHCSLLTLHLLPCLPACSPTLDDMLAPEELSSWLLQHLRRQAEQQLGEAVTGAVGGSWARSAALPLCRSAAPFICFEALIHVHGMNCVQFGSQSAAKRRVLLPNIATLGPAAPSLAACLPQVVTVPAHFGQAQQAATHAAAQLAGIPQVQLLQEPVAAALAYGINGGTDGDTVLVFDVGGGTFDVRQGRLADVPHLYCPLPFKGGKHP